MNSKYNPTKYFYLHSYRNCCCERDNDYFMIYKSMQSKNDVNTTSSYRNVRFTRNDN